MVGWLNEKQMISAPDQASTSTRKIPSQSIVRSRLHALELPIEVPLKGKAILNSQCDGNGRRVCELPQV